MKKLLLLALIALVLPARAAIYWLYDPGAKTLTLSDDSGAPCTPVTVYNVALQTSGGTALVKQSGNNGTAPYEGCGNGEAVLDLTLPVKDAAGTVYSLVALNDNSFESNNYIGKVKLPSTVTSVGQYSFRYCYYLKSFSFADDTSALSSIGGCVFGDCIRLESVSWPANIRDVGGYMFNGASALQGFYFPAVTNIGANAFTNAKNMQAVEFGGSAGDTITFVAQSFQNQGGGTRNLKTLLFHEATPVLGGGFETGGNNFLDHVGFTGLVVCLPMNAAKDDVADVWKTWVQNYLVAFAGSNFTFPAKNPDGTWTDGSWYHHASYSPARNTYVVRAWDPDGQTTSALLAY